MEGIKGLFGLSRSSGPGALHICVSQMLQYNSMASIVWNRLALYHSNCVMNYCSYQYKKHVQYIDAVM